MDLTQTAILFLGLISVGSALECYVCDQQPDNRDKCIKTTIQCRQHQDTCRSFIHWRQPSYWTPRSERIYSIDKSCDVRANCEQEQRSLGLRCMRDNYRDWKCTECCQGDRCNYYVTCSHCCGVHWLHNQFVNSAYPDETAPAGVVSSGSSLFTARSIKHTDQPGPHDVGSRSCTVRPTITVMSQNLLLCPSSISCYNASQLFYKMLPKTFTVFPSDSIRDIIFNPSLAIHVNIPTSK